MRRPTHGALFFGPTQGVQAKRRLMLFRIATRINLLLQPQQAEVAGLVRSESRNFNVVAEQIRILRDLVHRSAKELLLIVETGPPSEIGADFQILPHAMAYHILRVDA